MSWGISQRHGRRIHYKRWDSCGRTVMARIGFVGLGNMGGPMLANLLKAGHDLTAFDLVPSAMTRAQENGARVAASAVEAAQNVEFFISMLPASKHVEGLYLQPDATGKCLLDRID